MPERPPLGEQNDGQRRCSRLLGHDDNGECLCDAQAAQHIIYWWGEVPEGGNPDECWDHGFACQWHWDEYRRQWSCEASHPLGDACGMPGSVYVRERNECVFVGLDTVEPVRAVAQPVLVVVGSQVSDAAE